MISSKIKYLFSYLLPHRQRQALKRRLFVVRDMTTRLQNLRRAGFVPTGAIDGGAYRGDWAVEFWSVFPAVNVWLVEPQPGCQESLHRLVRQHPGSQVIASALSAEAGMAEFSLGETNSGLFTGDLHSPNVIQVPTVRLEDLLLNYPLVQPNLLKGTSKNHQGT
jgi:FkbM family methyltransferase